MSYNRKITEYALLPNGAFPLDARSHFKSLAEAYKTVIQAEVSTVETHLQMFVEDLQHQQVELQAYTSFNKMVITIYAVVIMKLLAN